MEKSLLVRSEILCLGFDSLTGNHMYSHLSEEIFPLLVPTQLAHKKNIFCNFYSIFQIYMKFSTLWKKRMSFIASIFRRLLTPKNVVSWMPENSCFRTPFWTQRVNGHKTLLKCPRQCSDAIFPLTSGT